MSKIANFFSSFSLRKLLLNKRFTIPFSIFLAFFIWLFIVTKQNPIIQRSFANMTVNLNLENTIASENDMNIVGDISSQKFTVVLRGPTYLISSLKSQDISLYASAASVNSPGEYDLEVAVTQNTNTNGCEVLSITPSTVKVSFDYIETKEFTVKALAEGVTAQEGLIAENGVVSTTENDTITVTGPRTVINKIDSVVALAKVDKTLSVSETFDADIVLYDADGKKISNKNLVLSESKVKITVPISKKKTVPVVVAFSNMPKGFDTSSLSYKLNFKEVTVIGAPDTVDKTKEVTLSPIDISSLSKDSNSFDVSAKLPEGVRLLDNIEHFTVEFELNRYSQKTINVNNFKFENLDSGLTAKGVSLKNVKVFGPTKSLGSITDASTYAIVDLSKKVAGEHTLEVLICFDNRNDVWALGSYTTAVTINKK